PSCFPYASTSLFRSLLLPTGFHVSRGTLDHTSSFLVSITGLLPSMAELSNSLHLRYCIHVVCPQPQRSKLHWGCGHTTWMQYRKDRKSTRLNSSHVA